MKFVVTHFAPDTPQNQKNIVILSVKDTTKNTLKSKKMVILNSLKIMH
jgi:hypothetical protein